MVDEKSDQPNPGSVTLAHLVRDWLQTYKPDTAWRILPDAPFSALSKGVVLDGYGWYFTIYQDYLTAGIGITNTGERYDTGFLIDATDPEFFNKLKAHLDEAESTYPERHAALMQAAKDAIKRMEANSSPGIGLSEE